MFDLPTHPDGNFYSIPETNELFRKVTGELDDVADDVEGLETAVAGIIADKYKIVQVDIEKDTDLDNVEQPGFYSIPNTTVAGSLTHAPSGYNASGVLIVFRLAATTLIQCIFSSSNIYFRRKSTTGYAKWYYYTGTQES